MPQTPRVIAFSLCLALTQWGQTPRGLTPSAFALRGLNLHEDPTRQQDLKAGLEQAGQREPPAADRPAAGLEADAGILSFQSVPRTYRALREIGQYAWDRPLHLHYPDLMPARSLYSFLRGFLIYQSLVTERQKEAISIFLELDEAREAYLRKRASKVSETAVEEGLQMVHLMRLNLALGTFNDLEWIVPWDFLRFASGQIPLERVQFHLAFLAQQMLANGVVSEGERQELNSRMDRMLEALRSGRDARQETQGILDFQIGTFRWKPRVDGWQEVQGDDPLFLNGVTDILWQNWDALWGRGPDLVFEFSVDDRGYRLKDPTAAVIFRGRGSNLRMEKRGRMKFFLNPSGTELMIRTSLGECLLAASERVKNQAHALTSSSGLEEIGQGQLPATNRSAAGLEAAAPGWTQRFSDLRPLVVRFLDGLTDVTDGGKVADEEVLPFLNSGDRVLQIPVLPFSEAVAPTPKLLLVQSGLEAPPAIIAILKASGGFLYARDLRAVVVKNQRQLLIFL